MDSPATPQPALRKRLTRDVLWLTTGNVAIAGAQAVYLVLAAKLAGVTDAGRLAYATTLATQVLLLTGLQLRILQASDIHHEYAFSCYFTLRLATGLAALFVTLMAAALHGISSEIGLLLLGLGSTRLVESISEVILAHRQRQGDFVAVGRSLLVRASAALLCFSAALALTRTLSISVAAASFSTLLVFILHDLRLVRDETLIHRSLPVVVKLARRASSLGLTTLFGSTYSALPRYIIKAVLGDAALGFYATVAQLPLTGAVLVRSMSEASTPSLARHFQSGSGVRLPNLFWKLIFATSALYASGAMIAVLFGSQILVALYTTEHRLMVPLLVWLILSEAIVQFNSILMYSATASRRLIRQPHAMFCSLVVLAGASYWSAGAFGLIGVAIAGLLSNVFQLSAYLFVMNRPPDAGSLSNSGPPARHPVTVPTQ